MKGVDPSINEYVAKTRIFQKKCKKRRFIDFSAGREVFSGQNESVNTRREADSGHRETFNVRREGDNAKNGTVNGRRETDSVRRTSDSARRETCNVRRASDDVRRDVGSGRREICRTNPAIASYGKFSGRPEICHERTQRTQSRKPLCDLCVPLRLTRFAENDAPLPAGDCIEDFLNRDGSSCEQPPD